MKYHWHELSKGSAGEKDVWYYFGWVDGVHYGTLHLLDQVCTGWEVLVIYELQKTIEKGIVHFGYAMVHPISHNSESTMQMSSRNNLTTYHSEQQHISIVNKVYWYTIKVNYSWLMLKHTDQCTGLDYMEKILLCLTLRGWHDIDYTKVVDRRSTLNKKRNIPRAHPWCNQYCQKNLIFARCCARYLNRRKHISR